jgi:hypothetical protein
VLVAYFVCGQIFKVFLNEYFHTGTQSVLPAAMPYPEEVWRSQLTVKKCISKMLSIKMPLTIALKTRKVLDPVVCLNPYTAIR